MELSEARLLTARKRLESCRGHEDAIEAIREIVANLLGSEEMAIFDLRSKEASKLWSFGIKAKTCRLVDTLGEKGLDIMSRGEVWVEESTGGTGTARAFVPLRVGTQTLGVLAILQLLPQKSTFDASDIAIAQLLSDEGARALFSSASKRAAAD